MVTPQEIKEKALGKYRSFCQAYLNNVDFFPLEIRCDKGKPGDPFLERRKSIQRLLNRSDQKKKSGYSIQWETVNTRKYGTQSLVKRIYFKDAGHYLAYINKQTEFDHFIKNTALIRKNLPELEEWLGKNIAALETEPGLWPGLLDVCRWFMENPAPRIYLREIPLNVHTKFIEENKKILRSLLDFLLPEGRIDSSSNDISRRYGLKWDEPLVRCRYLSDGEETDIALPLGLFCQREVPGEVVFIIENKTNFLSFPLTENRAVLWGSGFAAAALKEITWLSRRRLYYWGDLDPPGFGILSLVRSFYPRVESFLMDTAAYRAFEEFATPFDSGQAALPPYLKPAEEETYRFLLDHPQTGRLEQERFTRDYVLQALKKTF